MEVQRVWYETLPDQCPPIEAFTPKAFVCYRLCSSKEVTCEDFHSHRLLFPNKKFRVSECVAKSISVYKNKSDLSKVLMLPPHRNKKVAQVTLHPHDGVALQTGEKNHYSWWRSDEFDIHKSVEVVT